MFEHLKLCTCIIFTFLLFLGNTNGQVLDRYGVNTGLSYAQQIWRVDGLDDFDDKFGYKVGLIANVFGENIISNKLSLRAELGYIEKGFRISDDFLDSSLDVFGINGKQVILNNINLNLSLKIDLIKRRSTLYTNIGWRSEYMLGYKDITIVDASSGMEIGLLEFQISAYNKWNMGGLFGVGIRTDDLYFIEFDYHPNIPYTFMEDDVYIQDSAFGIRFGFYLNEIFKKSE